MSEQIIEDLKTAETFDLDSTMYFLRKEEIKQRRKDKREEQKSFTDVTKFLHKYHVKKTVFQIAQPTFMSPSGQPLYAETMRTRCYSLNELAEFISGLNGDTVFIYSLTRTKFTPNDNKNGEYILRCVTETSGK